MGVDGAPRALLYSAARGSSLSLSRRRSFVGRCVLQERRLKNSNVNGARCVLSGLLCFFR